jgi:hypothetical protein
MALRIGDIADISQLLDCPRRRRKQPQRKPPPHDRRRHIAGRSRLITEKTEPYSICLRRLTTRTLGPSPLPEPSITERL